MQRLREKRNLNAPLTDVALKTYAEANSNLPSDENHAFVCGYKAFERGHFLICWTTVKLSSIQRRSRFLSTDSTYKLLWYVQYTLNSSWRTFRHNFPVLISGTVDINGRFHPTHIALSSHEDEEAFRLFFKSIRGDTAYAPDYLMADGSHAITNACSAEFEHTTRLMCWFHVSKCLKTHLRGKEFDSVRDKIWEDIHTLQLSTNDHQFKAGIANDTLF